MLTSAFVLAGRASFIVENPQGESVTVKVSKSAPKVNPRTGRPWNPTFFVSLRHNNAPWVYVGRLDGQTLIPTPLARTSETRPLRIAQWALDRIFTQTAVPAGYRLAHTGRCAKCGKLLRDAVSIARGFGPVCDETR